MPMKIPSAALAVMLTATAAHAHSPYLLPNTFDATDRDHITVQAAFTEHFFAPDVVMKADDYHAIGPDGARLTVTPTYLQDVAVFETATKANGTYRITTGTRAGRISKAVLNKGEWEFLDPEKPVPAGVNAVDMQSITRAEVYVSRGAPNDTALAMIGNGIEFHAVTHPSSLFVSQPAVFEALLDGKPLPRQTIELHRADETYADGDKGETLVTDAAGRFTVKPQAPGVYHVMTRYRIDAASGAPARSLTYALTFEVTK